MEFCKDRVFTSLNADELRAGDKVITARCMADLKTWVEADAEPNIIELIQDETNTDRFTCKCHGSNKTYDSPLAYLVERKENCTNCALKNSMQYCRIALSVLHKCKDYKPKTEQKAEKHYRPFKDVDELVKVWDAKIGTPNWGTDGDLTMPHIWVQSKNSSMGLDNSGVLITGFFGTGVTVDGQLYSMSALFDEMVFPDGSPCGVEE